MARRGATSGLVRNFIGRAARCAAALLAGAAALIGLASVAFAGEASQVAARGGFLMGQAVRCGVAAERLEPSAKLMGDLIVALSIDAQESTAAKDQLVDEIFTYALASASDGPAPSCMLVERDLERFERHHDVMSLAAKTGGSADARSAAKIAASGGKLALSPMTGGTRGHEMGERPGRRRLAD
jgi:hypothetical protein